MINWYLSYRERISHSYVCKSIKYEVDLVSILVVLHHVIEPKGTWDDDNNEGIFILRGRIMLLVH